ncbi:HAD family hydrolase [Streptomyces rimosus]|uniref:HAD family hydrolase n=1 Tax=Streptomyces rimosus TaxID=1927 RepID=UPI0005194D9C|nr:HAD family hydrolase [Streptomyces rimosus]
MPLLLLDLDNTLVDRDAAFRDAVVAFLGERALAASDADWLMAVDASGYTPRHKVAAAMTDRYGGRVAESAVKALLDRGGADRVVLPTAVRTALKEAGDSGWTCVVVTNGRTAQQEAKIRGCGLDQVVHGWVVSETVGHKKPEPDIFRAAAATAGVPIRDAWMIGDSPHADIAGAHGLGLRSVWISGDRVWSEAAFAPTRVARDAATAIRCVTGAQRPAA